MTQTPHEQGVGRTGGLPGANADPATALTPDDESAELMAGDVSTQAPASEPDHSGS